MDLNARALVLGISAARTLEKPCCRKLFHEHAKSPLYQACGAKGAGSVGRRRGGMRQRRVEPRRGDSILGGDEIPATMGTRERVPSARSAPPRKRSTKSDGRDKRDSE